MNFNESVRIQQTVNMVRSYPYAIYARGQSKFRSLRGPHIVVRWERKRCKMQINCNLFESFLVSPLSFPRLFALHVYFSAVSVFIFTINFFFSKLLFLLFVCIFFSLSHSITYRCAYFRTHRNVYMFHFQLRACNSQNLFTIFRNIPFHVGGGAVLIAKEWPI